MTKAEQWIKDYMEAANLFSDLRNKRPELRLSWRPIPGYRSHGYPTFKLNDEGNIEVSAVSQTFCTIEPTAALQLADFLQSLYQESVSPVDRKCLTECQHPDHNSKKG